jgi:hypothetical protein
MDSVEGDRGRGGINSPGGDPPVDPASTRGRFDRRGHELRGEGLAVPLETSAEPTSGVETLTPSLRGHSALTGVVQPRPRADPHKPC